MSVVNNPINITNAVVDGNNVTLSFVTSKTGSSSAPTEADYKPIKILIDNQETFICKNEESSASSQFTPITYTTNVSGNTRTYSVSNETLDLSTSIVKPEEDLMFVYIYSKNGTDPDYLEAVLPLYNEYNLYKRVFDNVKNDFAGCANSCKEYNDSASIIVLLKGLEYSLIVGDYRKAIDFWKAIHNSKSVTQGCNCR